MKKILSLSFALVLFSSLTWGQEKASPRKAAQADYPIYPNISYLRVKQADPDLWLDLFCSDLNQPNGKPVSALHVHINTGSLTKIAGTYTVYDSEDCSGSAATWLVDKDGDYANSPDGNVTITFKNMGANGYPIYNVSISGMWGCQNGWYKFKFYQDVEVRAFQNDLTTPVTLTDYYTIAVNSDNTTMGTITTGGGTTVKAANATMTVTATPNPGYEFDHWSDGGSQSHSVTFNEDKTLVAYFRTTATEATISLNAGVGGTVEGAGTFSTNTQRTITATPNSGYGFARWEDTNTHSLISTNASYQFKLVQDVDYSAIFYAPGNITAAPNEVNMGVVTGGGQYNGGTQVTLSAVANDGYVFLNWSDNVATSSRTIIVNGDATYTAVFKRKYQVTATSADLTKGTVSISPAPVGGYYYDGQQITLTATPKNLLCSFVKWQKNGADIVGDATLNVTVNANDSYVAVFEGVDATEINIQAAMNVNHGIGWDYCFYYWAKTYGYDIQIIGEYNVQFSSGKTLTTSDINLTKSYINDHGTKATITSLSGNFYTENGKNVLDAVVKCSNGKTYLLKLRGKTADSDDTAEDYNQTYASFNKKFENKEGNIWQASSQNGTGQRYSVTWCNHFFFVVDPTKEGTIPSGIYPLDDSQATGTLISTNGSDYQFYGSYYVQSYLYYVPASGYAEVVNTNGTYYVKFEGYSSRGYNYTVTIGTKPAETTHNITFKVAGQQDKVVATTEGQMPSYGGTPTRTSTAQYDYTFNSWNPTLVAATAPATYTAIFDSTLRSYTITIPAVENGSITVKNGETTINSGDKVAYGTTLTVTATANEGYRFSAWTGDGADSVTVNGDKTIGATFVALPQYTVTLQNSYGCDYKMIVNGVEYFFDPDYEGEEENDYPFYEGTTIRFEITSFADAAYDYGEFGYLDDYYNWNAQQAGSSWEFSLSGDVAVGAYGAIGEFNLQDVMPNDNYYTQTIPWGKNVRKLTLLRSFKARTWSTMCLPFTATLTDRLNEYIYTMESGSLSGMTLKINFSKTDMVIAGHPYVFYSRAAASNPYFEYLILPSTPTVATKTSYPEGADSLVSYVGVLNKTILLPAGNAYNRYLSSNTLYYPRANQGGSDTFKGTTIANDRAYFKIVDGKLESGVAPRRLVLTIDGESVVEEAAEEITELQPTRKYIEDGILIIERGNAKYDAQGHKLN